MPTKTSRAEPGSTRVSAIGSAGNPMPAKQPGRARLYVGFSHPYCRALPGNPMPANQPGRARLYVGVSQRQCHGS